MTSLAADTYAVVWYLQAAPNLSPAARAAIQDAIHHGYPVLVSAVTMVELIYLVEKGRIAASVLGNLEATLAQPAGGLQSVSFSHSTARVMRLIPRDLVPDMPDRMIAATALELGLPLVYPRSPNPGGIHSDDLVARTYVAQITCAPAPAPAVRWRH